MKEFIDMIKAAQEDVEQKARFYKTYKAVDEVCFKKEETFLQIKEKYEIDFIKSKFYYLGILRCWLDILKSNSQLSDNEKELCSYLKNEVVKTVTQSIFKRRDSLDYSRYEFYMDMEKEEKLEALKKYISGEGYDYRFSEKRFYDFFTLKGGSVVMSFINGYIEAIKLLNSNVKIMRDEELYTINSLFFLSEDDDDFEVIRINRDNIYEELVSKYCSLDEFISLDFSAINLLKEI